jgi:hypothetical protein
MPIRESQASEAFSFSMSQSDSEDFVLSRCARHLAENCKENCKSGSMNEEHKNMIVIDLVKARTEEDYQQRLDSIRQVNNAWADWLDERK